MKRFMLAAAAACALLSGQQQPTPPLPNFTPPTPLFRAILANDAPGVSSLLQSGADPNEERFIGASPLVTALMQQNPAVARVLIEKGADIHATDRGGSTPLMWAAAMENADTSIVEELLRRGADPNVKNKSGETALVWALRRGYTPVVRLLKQHGASDRAMVQDSIERSLSLLEKSATEFFKVSGCASCHNQSLPQMAAKRAKEKGIRVNTELWSRQSKAVIAVFKPFNEAMRAGKDGLPDPAITIPYMLLGMAAQDYKADETTAAMAHLLSTRQMADGSFDYFASRPPMESSGVTATALSIRALQVYGAGNDTQIAKAREWLRRAKAYTTEEKAMKLLGLAWAKADASDLRNAALPLMSEQRQDGGWGQLPALESDAYATGQALVALHEAGHMNERDDVYARGAAFLLRTQRPDGSWLVRGRSFPFQPYKESGFPHGKDQWISAAGTSWAVMALTIGLPSETQISELF
jgi:hypothetical protein